MKVETGKIVTLNYDLLSESGEIIETSDISGPVSFVHGRGAIIKGLDTRLEGMEAGQEDTFEFPPEEAFGKPEDGPVREIPRSEFPAGAKFEVGSTFEAGMPGGQNVKLEVLETGDDAVKVRMIHPLAGQTLSMSVTVVAVREPTAAERESGQVQSKPPPPPPGRAART